MKLLIWNLGEKPENPNWNLDFEMFLKDEIDKKII